jgi:hypothetical protein
LESSLEDVSLEFASGVLDSSFTSIQNGAVSSCVGQLIEFSQESQNLLQNSFLGFCYLGREYLVGHRKHPCWGWKVYSLTHNSATAPEMLVTPQRGVDACERGHLARY